MPSYPNAPKRSQGPPQSPLSLLQQARPLPQQVNILGLLGFQAAPGGSPDGRPLQHAESPLLVPFIEIPQVCLALPRRQGSDCGIARGG